MDHTEDSGVSTMTSALEKVRKAAYSNIHVYNNEVDALIRLMLWYLDNQASHPDDAIEQAVREIRGER